MTSPSKQVFKSFAEYAEFTNKLNRSNQKEQLLKDAREAASWGAPDHWSTGMSHSQLTSIIRRLINYIEAQ